MRAVIYVASLVMLSVAFSGCDDKENSPKNPEPGQVAITHVESLFDSLTNWENIEKDKLHVIRSGEELKSYIKDCETELPTVDFEKHSLLVVTGNASHGIVNMESELNRGDTNTYSFDVNTNSILRRNTPHGKSWYWLLPFPVRPTSAWT